MIAAPDPDAVRFPASDRPNPFIRYRRLLQIYGLARALGATDE